METEYRKISKHGENQEYNKLKANADAAAAKLKAEKQAQKREIKLRRKIGKELKQHQESKSI